MWLDEGLALAHNSCLQSFPGASARDEARIHSRTILREYLFGSQYYRLSRKEGLMMPEYLYHKIATQGICIMDVSMLEGTYHHLGMYVAGNAAPVQSAICNVL